MKYIARFLKNHDKTMQKQCIIIIFFAWFFANKI